MIIIANCNYNEYLNNICLLSRVILPKKNTLGLIRLKTGPMDFKLKAQKLLVGYNL